MYAHIVPSLLFHCHSTAMEDLCRDLLQSMAMCAPARVILAIVAQPPRAAADLCHRDPYMAACGRRLGGFLMCNVNNHADLIQ